MSKAWRWKVIGIIVLTFIMVLNLLPSLLQEDVLPLWYKDVFEKKIKLGLDLQGGIHMILGVEVSKAIKDKADRVAEDYTDFFTNEKIGIEYIKPINDEPELEFLMKTEEDMSKVKKELNDDNQRLTIKSSGGKDGRQIIVGFKSDYINDVKDKAVDQTMKTINNRIDQFGVTEPSITKRGDYSIQIQLPGVDDPERAKALIGRTAQLEFKIVDDESSFMSNLKDSLPEGITMDFYNYSGPNGAQVTESYLISKKRLTIVNFLDGKVPKDHEVAYSKFEDKFETKYRTYYLTKKAVLTGDYLIDARVQIDQQQNQPYVSLNFDKTGAKIFEKVTDLNKKKRMAIVLDGMVDSAPVIQEKIGGGRAQITLGGLKSFEELLNDARDLEIVLKAGALPAPVKILEERTVGPSLGQDSIEKGTKSILIGGIIVLIFMLIYYKIAGIIANLALMLNMCFIMAILAMFEATLTLPGLAGIALTIGMAVDANIIIFERIREELARGRTPRVSVDTGYKKAFSAIIDANVTTFIAGVVLYQYGSGPIKGFAVTLMIGIICSLFTAVVVTRQVFDYVTIGKQAKSLKI